MLAFCRHGWVWKAKHSAMTSTDGVATPHWHLINHAFSASNQFNWWFNLCRWWLRVRMAAEFPARVTNHDLKTVWCGTRSYMISCRFGRHIERFQGSEVTFWTIGLVRRTEVVAYNIWDIVKLYQAWMKLVTGGHMWGLWCNVQEVPLWNCFHGRLSELCIAMSQGLLTWLVFPSQIGVDCMQAGTRKSPPAIKWTK
jgi:hypothetical protein